MAFEENGPWSDYAQTAPQSAPSAPARPNTTTIYKVRTRDGYEFEFEAPTGSPEAELHKRAMQNAPQHPRSETGQIDLTGAVISPSTSYDQTALANYRPDARTPQPGEKLGADEDLAFNMDRVTLGGVLGEDSATKTGPHYTPEQEAQLVAAAKAGDAGRIVALSHQFGGSAGTQIDPEQAQKLAAYYSDPAHRGAEPGFDYSKTDAASEEAYNAKKFRGYDKLPIGELRKNDVLPEQADAFARGAALGLDDEIDGIVSSVIHGGTVEDNIAKARAIAKYDEQNHPVERIAGNFAGSLLLPTRVAKVGRPAAMTAMREALAAGADAKVARALAQQAARRAITGQMAKEGLAYGAGTGAAGADGDVEDRLVGGITGGATGLAAGAGTGAAATQLARLKGISSSDAREGRALIEAADRQGVDVLPADVGGPITRRATSMTAQTIVGGQPIIAASERMTTQAATARDRIAESVGTALGREAAGRDALSGAQKFIQSSGAAARSFYASAEKASDGIAVDAPKALAALDRNIAELAQTPGGASGLSTLRAIREDIAKGNLSVLGIRNMRTALRDQFAKEGLRGSDLERRVGQVVDAASEDVSDGLRSAGRPDAAAMFAKGDAAWRERVQTIDNVFRPIIGTRENPRSGEQIIRALTADLQGNNARAIKFLRSLPPEEQSNLRASIIGGLGRSRNGAQNAQGDAFSLPVFLTHWNEIGESAKAAYFGPEARAALNDLAKIGQGAKEALGYANRSNTGGALGGLMTIENALTGASILGGPVTFAKVVGSQYALGRLLASPRFARWLARAPKTSLSSPAYIDRLSRIAKAEPGIANEVLDLQRRLNAAFSSSTPAQAAADEPVDEPPWVQYQKQGQEEQNTSEQLP